MNTMPKGILKFLALVLLLLAQSCGDNGDPAPATEEVKPDPVRTEKGTSFGLSVSQVVGASGGTVASADGRLTISIPEGALAANTVITVEPISNNVSLAVGNAYRLGPAGTTFTEPVTLTFRYDEGMLANKPARTLWVTTQNSDGSWSAHIRSVVDESAGTVTATTTHFSDWALGRFIDFKIAPQSHTLMVGNSVSLALVGFASGGDDSPDDLVRLTPIVDDGLEPLTPLTPIPPVESRLVQFRVGNWSLNGVSAPVSNKNGSLNASGNACTFTAPSERPTPNMVAVTAELETTNKEGSKSKLLVVSHITIIDGKYFLRVNVDGTEYVYIQYGFDGTVPDGDDFAIVNGAFVDGNSFGISGAYTSGNNVTNIFLATFSNPGVGTATVGCENDGQPDDRVNYNYSAATAGLSNSYSRRWLENDICESEELCSAFSRTFTVYENEVLGEVKGSFSGTLYDIEHDGCETSDSHTVSGEFFLVRSY